VLFQGDDAFKFTVEHPILTDSNTGGSMARAKDLIQNRNNDNYNTTWRTSFVSARAEHTAAPGRARERESRE